MKRRLIYDTKFPSDNYWDMYTEIDGEILEGWGFYSFEDDRTYVSSFIK